MRILFLTQYYPPETGAAPLRAYHFATKLAGRGHEVTVLTGMPNHPSGRKQQEFRWKLGASERLDGVRVIRSYLFATPRKTFLTRMLNQISFAVSAFVRGCFTPKCDVILITSPPLFLGVSGWLLGHVKGAPYVLDVRDYWPHAAVALGQLTSKRVIRLAERMELFLYAHAAWIVAVTPGMRRLMVKRGIPGHRVVLIPNGADTDCFTPAENDVGRVANGKWTVLYSGTHGLVHGMEMILDAAELLVDDERIRFVMVGDGVAKDALVADAQRRKLSNMEFLPSQQPESLAERIRNSDVCIATTTGGSFSEGTVPVKMFDYMACGKPVVAAVAGDARTIMAEADGGVIVAPGDSAALASTLLRLLEDKDERSRLGKSGHEYVRWSYSRQHLAGRMNDLLERVVRRERILGGGRMEFRRYLTAKYLIDAALASLSLIVMSPVLALTALLVKIDSRGPVIYRQRRIGIYSQEFTIYKFRTMHVHTPELATDLLAPTIHDYTTRIGRLLRRLSFDELPNLWNILMGDMSIVGPRPALYNQYDLIDERRKVGGDVMRPGLTGWAQINGRDSITQSEKVRLDEFYARNCSLALDLGIVIGTLRTVSRTEDVGDGRPVEDSEQGGKE
jgi:lipopolysaccharide/colanic/teichoic acid biosynthesis glycosyltransferase/glycosyltransferase involved in cell wall biosynthesis